MNVCVRIIFTKNKTDFSLIIVITIISEESQFFKLKKEMTDILFNIEYLLFTVEIKFTKNKIIFLFIFIIHCIGS